jgi:hypothetical protein
MTTPQGVREKLDRAHMHRQDLECRVERFRHSDAYCVARETDVEAGKRRWIFHLRKEPPVSEWGVIIGDCLFNFRSALDHVALELAVTHAASIGRTLTAEEEGKSEFPIFHKRDPTIRELDKRIGAIHPEARSLIESMQPYGRTDRAILEYLDVLHNFDKHRRLHLVVSANTGMSVMGERFPFDVMNLGVPLEDGDVLLQIPLSHDPEGHIDPHFQFGIAFSESGPGAEAPDVLMTLFWMGQHIGERVLLPLDRFLAPQS